MDWIKELIGSWGKTRKVSMAATVDHVELSSTHLVVGLGIDFHNKTDEPIPVKEIRMIAYINGRRAEPLRFYPLERFERAMNNNRISKKNVRPFTLPPHEIHTEQLRFISQEVVDISPGGYAINVELTDTSSASYKSRVKIRVDKSIKYRRDEAWQEN